MPQALLPVKSPPPCWSISVVATCCWALRASGSLSVKSDALVAAKFAMAQKAGLVPVLCVGETLAERRGSV